MKGYVFRYYKPFMAGGGMVAVVAGDEDEAHTLAWQSFTHARPRERITRKRVHLVTSTDSPGCLMWSWGP